MEKETVVSWKQFGKDIEKLIITLQEYFRQHPSLKCKLLVITKGGMIPAFYLAKHLPIAYVETLCIKSYKNKKKSDKLRVIPSGKKVEATRNWLIVDDLVDTGDTMKIAKKYFPNSKVATLYKKPHSPEPDFYAREVKGWVKFPWDILHNF